MRRAWVIALVVMAGCGGAEREAAPPPAAAEPAQPPGRDVRFRATDGERVAARFTPAGADAPAVVLLHEIHGGIDQWDALVPDLHEAGFATLAYESRGAIDERDRLPDALGALRWLGRRADHVAFVGASIGASTAVLAIAGRARGRLDAAVALSPPDSPDLWALQDAGRYRPHDVLFVSDRRESSAVETLMEGAARSDAMTSERPGHGVALLAEPGVRDAVLAWLDERVR